MAKVLSALLHPLPEESSRTRHLLRLHSWASRFSPVVALDAPSSAGSPLRDSAGQAAEAFGCEDPRYFGLNLEVENSLRFFKGSTRLLHRFQEELESMGFKTKAAIAPTLGSAWALSRYGPGRSSIIEKEQLTAALALLPVRALRISKKTNALLEEVNLLRIEDLFRIPAKALASRFSKELVTRLDQALGRLEEPLVALPFCPAVSARCAFDGPVSQSEALLLAAERLLDEVLQKLGEETKHAARLVLEVEAVGMPRTRKEIVLSRPSANKKHLFSLLGSRLESVQMGSGVLSMRLYVPRTETVKPRYLSITGEAFESQESSSLFKDPAFGEFLDILSQRLGTENVLRLHCRESHLPEKSYCFRPFSRPEQLKTLSERSESNGAPVVETERPSVLFYNPHPIEAMSVLPDSPPFWLRWRGSTYHLIAGSGPERIAPEWWGHNDFHSGTRDYFKVQLPTGLWLWIFRTTVPGQAPRPAGTADPEGPKGAVATAGNKWFLQGIWA